MRDFEVFKLNLLCDHCGFHRDTRFYDGAVLCDDCAQDVGLVECENCHARLDPSVSECPLCGQGVAHDPL